MLQLKSEINDKVDNVKCWEYTQYFITINNSSICSFYGKPFDRKDITRVFNKPKQLNTTNIS